MQSKTKQKERSPLGAHTGVVRWQNIGHKQAQGVLEPGETLVKDLVT